MIYKARLKKVHEEMEKRDIKAVVLCNSPNMYYVTGYAPKLDERLQLAVITEEKEFMVVPLLYRDTAKLSCAIQEMFVWSDSENYADVMKKAFGGKTYRNEKIAIDTHLRFMHMSAIMKTCPDAKFVDANEIFDTLRLIKSPEELKMLAASGKMSDELMDIAIGYVKQGKSELEIKNLIEYEYLNRGMTDGFSNLIAMGKNSALVHHVSGNAAPQDGDSVYLDIGGALNHHWSDITRTVHIGEPSPRYIECYEAVKKAQELAKEAVKPGVTANDVHMAAYDYLESKGLGKYFLHRTGHGIGLEGHESPSIVTGNSLVLQEGMTFSVEPGVYFEGAFGIRIEDVVAVTESGYTSMTSYTRELITL